MARIRSIKPEFWESEDVGLLSRDARLLFIATWNLADDEGLLRWSPAYVKANAFIYDDDIDLDTVKLLMSELVDAGFLLAYYSGRTKTDLAWIPSFPKHQKPNRPQPSKLAPPPLQEARVREAYAGRDDHRCYLCGDEILPVRGNGFDDDDAVLPARGLSIDHVEPRSAGGSDYPSNMRSTHKECNSRKGSRTSSLNGHGADTEQDTELFTPVGEGSGEGEKRRKRRPPPDFLPSDEHAIYATDNGLNLADERQKWLTWCEANGKTYQSLNAGFTTWLHRAVEYGRGSPPVATLEELAKPKESSCPLGLCQGDGLIQLGEYDDGRPHFEDCECRA